MERNDLEKARALMLSQIRATAADTASWTGRGKFSDRTMTAIESVPRHVFVPRELKGAAYANRPQRIGCGQTISQPYIVALMTDFLELAGTEKVLEIGTGCGYQAAVISRCLPNGFLFGVESSAYLANGAKRRLNSLGYKNISVRCGNGYDGWPEEAPFKAIIVTAAPERVPRTLVGQLENGGRMILPVGRPNRSQTLTFIRKNSLGQVRADRVLPVSFVPLVDFG